MSSVKYIICLVFYSYFICSGSTFPSEISVNDLGSQELSTTKSGFTVRLNKNPAINVPQSKNLLIGHCDSIENGQDQESVIVYTDHQIVENEGPSTLNGTIEIYVDAPIKITCIKVMNQADDDNAATPSYNSGGIGLNWVYIDVFCKYSKGFDFYIEILGKYTNTEVNHNTI